MVFQRLICVSPVYTQVASLEGELQANVIEKLSILQEKLAYASALQQKDTSYLDRVDSYIKQAEVYENLAKQSTSQTEIERNQNLKSEAIQQARENQQKARQIRAECYKTTREIVELYWNYLPLEDQVAFERWAKNEANQNFEALEKKSEELAKAVSYFVISVFKGVEKSKSIPKLSLELLEIPKASHESKAQPPSWEEEKEFIDMLIELGKEPTDAEYMQEEIEVFERVLEKLNKE
jgi:uncharacterized coiled-coil DUF342 family protein